MSSKSKKISSILKKIMHPGHTLKQRAVRSGFWLASYKIVERGFRFIKTLIIARLLAPSDFGLFGIACLAVDVMQTFTETGIGSALIQKKGEIKEYLNTAWTIQLLKAAIISTVLFIFAPNIARFFNNSQAAPLMRLVAVNVLVSGFVNIGVIYFEKDIEFGKQRLVSLAKLVVGFSVSLVLAFILRNAWALAWGMLAGTIANCVASYIAHPYRPRIDLNVKKAKELIHFGKWIFLTTIVVFVSTQGDDIVVGKVLGATALGLYTMAYAISNLAATEVTHLISKIMFPAYSKIQDDKRKLKGIYLRILEMVCFVNIPLTVLIIYFGHSFVYLVMGEKWLPMVIPLQLLAVYGLVRSMAATGGPIYLAIGLPELDFKMNFIRAVTVILLIYPVAICYGIAGASVVAILSILATIPIFISTLKKHVSINAKDYILASMPTIGATATMLLICMLLRTLMPDINILRFVIIGTTAVVTYLASLLLLALVFKIGPLTQLVILKHYFQKKETT